MILNIIKYPIMTEKTYKQQSLNKYTFEVDRKANKTEIKRAFEKLFNVKVASVNVVNYPGKKKRVGKYTGRKNHARYAIITLKPGEKLAIMGDDALAAANAPLNETPELVSAAEEKVNLMTEEKTADPEPVNEAEIVKEEKDKEK